MLTKIALFLGCFYCSGFLYGAKFYFKTSSEAIYKVVNPFDSDNDFNNIIVFNESGYFKPCYNAFENAFYVYGKENTIYQISNETTCDDMQPFRLSTTRLIKSQVDYAMNAPKSTSIDNWFLKILHPNELYESKIKVGKGEKNRDCKLKIKMYNFFTNTGYVYIIVNEKKHELRLRGQDEAIFTLPYETSDDLLSVTIYSPTLKLGLEFFEYNIINKVISYTESFDIYTYDNDHIFSPEYVKTSSKANIEKWSNNFLYFTLMDDKLVQISIVDTITSFKNVFVQKKSDVSDVELREIDSLTHELTEFLVIYNPEFDACMDVFVDAIKQIANHQKITKVNSQKIYDEYSFSSKSCTAIKQFINSVMPNYVVLIGDASMKTDAVNNLMPTFYIKDTRNGSILQSDFPYTYTIDPHDPTIIVSRIPCKTCNELTIYLNKVNNFALKNKKNKFLVADELNLNLKKGFNQDDVSYFHLKGTPKIKDLIFDEDLIQVINTGNPSYVLHSGHGAIKCWNINCTIDISDFKQLNKGNAFMLIDLSCWTGLFNHYTEDSLIEQLMNLEDSGVVSAVASTSYGREDNSKLILEYFLVLLKYNDIGTAFNLVKKNLLKQGKISASEAYAMNLFGIPNI